MAEETKNQNDTKDVTPVVVEPKEEKAEAAPTVKPTESNPELEEKTANDGSLLINQGEAATTSAAPAETPTPSNEPTEPIVVQPSAPMTEQPVVVNAQDVEEANKSETESLQAEIEGLTGEIQALESKIERLTNTGSPVESPVTKEEKKTEETKKQDEKPLEMPKPIEPQAAPVEVTPPATMPEPKPEMPKPMSTPSPITDIYNKVGSPEPKKPSDDLNDLNESQGPSAVGMIGEVMAIIGIILTILLVASPLFKETIGTSLYTTISSVGWLTTVATLALGFLLLVLGKAKASMIIIGLLFLLIAGFMYVGLNYPSILGPLQGSLDSVFGFYRA